MRRTKTMLMGDLLEEFFRRPYIAAKVAEGKLPDTWRAVVGDRAADLTSELRLERRILHVRIQSSVLRQELFYQRDALRAEPPLGRRLHPRRHRPIAHRRQKIGSSATEGPIFHCRTDGRKINRTWSSRTTCT